MHQPRVSIITINYNNPSVTAALLESLRHVTYQNIEIIVVDNNSQKGNTASLKEKFPEIKLICSDKNLGFAGGNNLGVRQASGKYILFLNNDTEVAPNFLEPLVNVLEHDASIGMVSSKLIYFDSNNTLQYAGSHGIDPVTGRGKRIGHGQKDIGQYDNVYETGLGHGAAMMVPMSVIEKAGMMPELYFLYYEEHDWCEMIKRAGFRIYYCGLSKVYHKESMSVGKNSPLKEFYMARNRLLFIRRNYIGSDFLSSFSFFMLASVPKALLVHLGKLNLQLFWAYSRGLFQHFTLKNIHQRISIN